MTSLILDQGDRPHLPEVHRAINELRLKGAKAWHYRATVSGSFRRHLPQVQAAMDDLVHHRVRILSPGGTVALGEEGGFTFLASDPSTDIGVTEEAHLRAISRSDFLWIVCPDGQWGLSTALEIGWAVGKDKLIFCQNELSDPGDGLVDIRRLVQTVDSVEEALRIVERRRDQFRKALTLLPGFHTP